MCCDDRLKRQPIPAISEDQLPTPCDKVKAFYHSHVMVDEAEPAGELRMQDDQSINPGGVPVRKVPNIEILGIFVIAIPLYFIFDSRGDDLRGFAAAISLGVVLAMTSLLRSLIHQFNFWLSLVAIALVHAALVFALPHGGHVSFGITFAPLVILDLYLCAKLLAAVCGQKLRS